MRAVARPSPKAVESGPGGAVQRSVSSRDPSRAMASGSSPMSLATPLRTASGRSLTLRSTRTGVPSAVASSCTPPLSLRMKAARFIAATNGP